MSMAAAISTKTVSGNNKNSGSAAYRCSDEEDSSILADLAAMFPSLDHDVLVSVLQAHGRVQTTVEYLLTNNCGGPRPPVSSVSVDPAQDMLGLFSVEEIGGLPEILPRFACEEGREDTGDDGSNNESQSIGEVQEMGTQSQEDVIPDNDPLPTYAEACDGKKPASVLYVSHEQNELCFVKDTRGPTCYVDIPSVEQSEIAALVEKKSRKEKKIKSPWKIGKPKTRKKGDTKYKELVDGAAAAVRVTNCSHSDDYQPLIDTDDELLQEQN